MPNEYIEKYQGPDGTTYDINSKLSKNTSGLLWGTVDSYNSTDHIFNISVPNGITDYSTGYSGMVFACMNTTNITPGPSDKILMNNAINGYIIDSCSGASNNTWKPGVIGIFIHNGSDWIYVRSQDTNTTYTFAGGTDGFTVTPSGGTAQIVPITVTGASTKILSSYYDSRPTTANVEFHDAGLRYFVATSSMTEGKPPHDAKIIQLPWDSSGATGWDSQLAVASGNEGVYFRGQSNGTWGSWYKLVDVTGAVMSGDIKFDTTSSAAATADGKGIVWKETGYGEKFEFRPNFWGDGDGNFLALKSCNGGAGTDPSTTDKIRIHSSGNMEFMNPADSPYITTPGGSTSYVNGAKGYRAGIYHKHTYNVSEWAPAVCIQTKNNGSWQIGCYDGEHLEFVNFTKTNIDAGTNAANSNIHFTSDGGIICLNGTFYAKDKDMPTTPTTTRYATGFYLRDSQNYDYAYLRNHSLDNGQKGLQLEVRRVINNSTIYNTLNMRIASDGTRVVEFNYPAAWRSGLGLGASALANYDWSTFGTEDTTNTWVPVASNNNIYHRVLSGTYNNKSVVGATSAQHNLPSYANNVIPTTQYLAYWQGGYGAGTTSNLRYVSDYLQFGSSKRLEIYSNGTQSTYFYPNPSEVSYGLFLGVSSSSWCFKPSGNGTLTLGQSGSRWGQIYSTSSSISTSDRNVKNTIEPIADKYEELFKKLKPVTFKFNEGTSDRKHTGFISQDVEEAMDELEMSHKDFAGFCKDNKVRVINEPVLDENGEVLTPTREEPIEGEYDYSLRYEEFIALNTHMIQKLMNKIEVLEARIAELENR